MIGEKLVTWDIFTPGYRWDFKTLKTSKLVKNAIRLKSHSDWFNVNKENLSKGKLKSDTDFCCIFNLIDIFNIWFVFKDHHPLNE